MPVILDRESYDSWLDAGMNDTGIVSELLKSYDVFSVSATSTSAMSCSAPESPAACGVKLKPSVSPLK